MHTVRICFFYDDCGNLTKNERGVTEFLMSRSEDLSVKGHLSRVLEFVLIHHMVKIA